MKDKELPIWLVILPTIMLILAPIVEWPYGYYQILRLIVSLAAGMVSLITYAEKQKIWLGIFAMIVLLFNPLIPIHFEREIWAFIDVITAGIFVVYYLHIKGVFPNITKNW